MLLIEGSEVDHEAGVPRPKNARPADASVRNHSVGDRDHARVKDEALNPHPSASDTVRL